MTVRLKTRKQDSTGGRKEGKRVRQMGRISCNPGFARAGRTPFPNLND
jgi:hypothetical protein